MNASEAAVPPGESRETPDFVPSELPPAGTLPTQIYMSNTGNLGILSEDEVADTVSYYSTLLTQKAIIRAIRSGDGAVAADQKELRDTLPDLEDNRTDLMETLEDTDLVPLLHDHADELDVALHLGREPGHTQLAGESTFESYGRVGHSPARYNVLLRERDSRQRVHEIISTSAVNGQMHRIFT